MQLEILDINNQKTTSLIDFFNETLKEVPAEIKRMEESINSGNLSLSRKCRLVGILHQLQTEQLIDERLSKFFGHIILKRPRIEISLEECQALDKYNTRKVKNEVYQYVENQLSILNSYSKLLQFYVVDVDDMIGQERFTVDIGWKF